LYGKSPIVYVFHLLLVECRILAKERKLESQSQKPIPISGEFHKARLVI